MWRFSKAFGSGNYRLVVTWRKASKMHAVMPSTLGASTYSRNDKSHKKSIRGEHTVGPSSNRWKA